MKNRLILGLSLSLVGWLSICLFAESAESKDIIRDKSPDGKFALRITKEDVGWAAAIIDLNTSVYFRNGSEFENVELPDIPECKNSPKKGESHVKTVETTTKPQKWLSSGALDLKVQLGDLMEKGDNQRGQTCTQIVTVVFDSSHKASVQSVKRVKSD